MVVLLFIYGFPSYDRGRCSIFHWAKKWFRVVSLCPARSGSRTWNESVYKLVAAIIKIYATFCGSVFCSLLRSDPISVASIAVFIAFTESALIAYSPVISLAIAWSLTTLLSCCVSLSSLIVSQSAFEACLTLRSLTTSPVFPLWQRTSWERWRM